MNWFRWDGVDLILQLRIQPGASSTAFAGLHGEQLKVRIHAPAVEGRANAALLELLCTSFATHKTHISLERGARGRTKSVRIHAPGTLPDALRQLGLSFATT